MMTARIFMLTVGLITLYFSSICAVNPKRKFEYKNSFKGPHLVQRDGTIPFWEHGGHAIASDESIRITPSLRSKKGQVWNKEQMKKDHWEIEVTFRVSGRGRIGADGLAIWYTEKKGEEGPVFGSSDQWKGLGVFLDSFDNDGQHNNPYIMAMNNDGNMKYDHQTDGSTQQLGGCLRDFRNKPFPVKVKVEYYMNVLTVYFHNGMTNNNDFEMCMRIENVFLPKEGYFGISAATGGLAENNHADDHDVFAFITHSLTERTADQPGTGQEVTEEEKQKFEREFDEYYQKLQKARQEYQQEHPDQTPPPQEGEWFEEQDIKELKMIFEGQNQIHGVIKDLQRKLDEIIGRQERTMSQISMLSTQQGGQQQQPPQGGQGVPQLPNVDTIKRHEVDMVLNNQRELRTTLNDLKYSVNEVHVKANNIQNQAGGKGDAQMSQDVKNQMNNLQADLKVLLNRPPLGEYDDDSRKGKKDSKRSKDMPQMPNCPPPATGNCVTTLYFFLFIAAQAAIFIIFTAYRSSREAQAKKFY